MLNININRTDDTVKIEATGNMLTLIGELTFVIHDFYNSMYKHDPDMAAVFQSNLVGVLSDPDSPVWQLHEPYGASFIMSIPNPDREGDAE